MFLIILGENAELGLVKLTSEQAEVYDTKSEDEFIEFMEDIVDLSGNNSHWSVSLNDAIEIEVKGELTFTVPSAHTRYDSTFITIE